MSHMSQLSVTVINQGDYWVGEHDWVMDTARGAIEKIWGVPPLLVREGGTMPISSFLSRQLKAPAVHLPLGQSSDSAHLPNERIRITNLVNGKVLVFVL